MCSLPMVRLGIFTAEFHGGRAAVLPPAIPDPAIPAPAIPDPAIPDRANLS